jgi:phospholipase C
MMPMSIGRALAIAAHRVTGTIKDVEYVVILMQENRSFDHYFGSMRGVRGFNDPRSVRLLNASPSGISRPLRRRRNTHPRADSVTRQLTSWPFYGSISPLLTSPEAPDYLRPFAGHVETGTPSISDPAIFQEA